MMSLWALGFFHYYYFSEWLINGIAIWTGSPFLLPLMPSNLLLLGPGPMEAYWLLGLEEFLFSVEMVQGSFSYILKNWLETDAEAKGMDLMLQWNWTGLGNVGLSKWDRPQTELIVCKTGEPTLFLHVHYSMY